MVSNDTLGNTCGFSLVAAPGWASPGALVIAAAMWGWDVGGGSLLCYCGQQSSKCINTILVVCGVFENNYCNPFDFFLLLGNSDVFSDELGLSKVHVVCSSCTWFCHSVRFWMKLKNTASKFITCLTQSQMKMKTLKSRPGFSRCSPGCTG